MDYNDFIKLPVNEFKKNISQLNIASLKKGQVIEFFNKSKDVSLLNTILNGKPNLINDVDPQDVSLVEYLADKEYTTTISNYAQYIDLTLPASNNMNLVGYLTKKGLASALSSILSYNPKVINECGKDGISPVEYLIDREWTNILSNFAQYIDLTLQASTGMNLICYMIKKGLSTSLSKILSYNPQIINECGSHGIYPVEYLADKEWSNMLTNFAQYIDLTLPASNEMNLGCYLIKKGLPTAFATILAYRPKIINECGKNGIHPVEYLADKEYTTTLTNYAQYIDLTLPASNGLNLATYIIKKGLPNILANVLVYNPHIINECGEDGIYPVEYLADKNYTNTIKKFQEYIDFNLLSSKQTTLAEYVNKKTGLVIKNSNPSHLSVNNVVKPVKGKKKKDLVKEIIKEVVISESVNIPVIQSNITEFDHFKENILSKILPDVEEPKIEQSFKEQLKAKIKSRL